MLNLRFLLVGGCQIAAPADCSWCQQAPSRRRRPPSPHSNDPHDFTETPQELADYIAKLTPEDLERIRADVRELERLGLLPKKGAR